MKKIFISRKIIYFVFAIFMVAIFAYSGITLCNMSKQQLNQVEIQTCQSVGGGVVDNYIEEISQVDMQNSEGDNIAENYVEEGSPEAVGGEYTISVTVNNGTCLIQGYDLNWYHTGWRDINPGGTSGSFYDSGAWFFKDKWAMSEDWIEMQVASFSPNYGYKFSSMYVYSGKTGNLAGHYVSSPLHFTSIYSGLNFYAGGNINIYVYFVEDVQSYSISYSNLNGISGSVANSLPDYYYSNQTTTIPSISKNGYDFLGWTGSNGGSYQQTVTISSGSSGNKSYTANWRAKTYTIYFEKEGGSGGSSSMQVTYEQTVSYMSPPSRSNYEFDGYYYNGTCLFESSQSYYQPWTYFYSYNITCYARWTPKTFTVSFNNSGGSGGPGSVSVRYESALSNINSLPTRQGYIFEGYKYNGNLIYNASGTSQISRYTYGNITVNAQWKLKTFSITFAKDAGITSFDYKIVNSWVYGSVGQTATNVTAFSQVEVVIKGVVDGYFWKTFEITGVSGTDYTLSTAINANPIKLQVYNAITITAKSQIKVAVSTCSNGSGSYSVNGNGGGVRFASASTFAPEIEQGVNPNSDITFYARPNYACTFKGFYSGYNNNGGTGTQYPATESGGIYSATILNVTTSYQVYAIFEFIMNELTAYAYSSDTTTFGNTSDSNGGTVVVSGGSAGATSTHQIGYTIFTSVIAQEKPNYKFVGWYSSLESLKDDTTNSTPVSLLNTFEFQMENATTKYYAKFMKLFAVTLLKTTGVESFTIAGRDNLVPTTLNGLEGVSTTYYYGQVIGDMTCYIDTIRYEWKNWANTSSNTPAGLESQLNGSVIRSITMENYDIVLTAYTNPQSFGLNVYAVYADNEILNKGSSKGGTVRINSRPATAKEIGFPITYNTNEATITAKANTGYTFFGWFKNLDTDTNTYSNPYYEGTPSGKALSIETMDIYGLTYYAVFIKNYNVYLYYNINEIETAKLSNSVLKDTGNDVKYLQATFYYNQKIDELSVAICYGFKFTHWDVGDNNFEPTNFDETLKDQENSIFMPAGDCYLTAVTDAAQFNLIVRSCYSNTGEFVYDTTIGGQIQIENRTKAGTDKLAVNYKNKTTLTAYASEKYSFYGWFRVLGNGTQLIDKSVGFQSTEEQIQTEPMIASETGMVYIALFLQKLNVTLIANDNSGIDPNGFPNLNEYYTYGDLVTIDATALPSYEFDKWILSATSASPEGFLATQKNQTFIVNGNIEITATAKNQNHTLTVHIMTEDVSGNIILNSSGGIVEVPENGLVSYGFDITKLVKANKGFEFDWFYKDATCTEYTVNKELGKVNMPNENLTVYAKFIRLYYNLTTNYYMTSEEDNLTKVLGTDIEVFTADSYQLKYGTTTFLQAVVKIGYILEGIYFDAECTDKYNYGANFTYTDSTRTYKILSSAMTMGGQTYYALFTREKYQITVAKSHEGLKVNVIEKAHYGEVVNFTAELGSGLKNLDVEVFGVNQIRLDIVNNSFVMPNYDVTLNVTAEIIRFNITFDANKGFYDKEEYVVNSFGQVLGFVDYNASNYTYYLDEDKLIENPEIGVPIPTCSGYTFKGYNTEADGSGITYVSYSSVFSYKICDFDEDKIFYAIWEVTIPDVSIAYAQPFQTDVTYNRLFQEALKVVILNKSPKITYEYFWYKTGEPNVVATTEVLSLRSVNQSGLYYCTVKIKDSGLQKTTDNLQFTINKANIYLNIGNHTNIGKLTYVLIKDNIAGLMPMHNFVSGSMTFDILNNETTIYNNSTNKSEIDFQLVLNTMENGIMVEEQDGFALSSNYDFTLYNEIIIQKLINIVDFSISGYERTINSDFTYNDSTIISNIPSFGVTYSLGFAGSPSNSNGIEHYYISESKTSGTVTIKITLSNATYNFVVMKINGEDVTLTPVNNVVTFILSEHLKKVGDHSECDIKMYFSNQCLINFDYDFTENEEKDGYATKEIVRIIQENGGLFVAPNTVSFSRIGFTFGGWYTDSNRNIEVASYWTSNKNETTIYAKWILNNLSDENVSLYINKDEINMLNKVYDGGSVVLSVKYVNPYVSLTANWYKNNSLLNKTGDLVLINVADSGIYTCSVTTTYNSQNYTLLKGVKTAEITISQHELNLTEIVFEKEYDGTTEISYSNYNTGIKDERISFTADFVSPNVSIIGSEIQSIEITNFILQGIAGTKIDNYKLTEDKIYGKITQYNYQINRTTENDKTYDGQVFSRPYSNFITFKNDNVQIINYTLISSKADVGEYNKESDSLRFEYEITTEDGTLINSTNYNITLSNASFVKIGKRLITSVSFDNNTILYDGTKKMIYITFNEVNPSNEDLPLGVEEIIYSYEDNVIVTPIFENAGDYSVSAKLICDNNHCTNFPNDTLNAILTISKINFALTFYYNGTEITSSNNEFEYTDSNMYNLFTVAPRLLTGTVSPTVEKEIQYNLLETLEVKEIGDYKFTIKNNYDTVNYYINDEDISTIFKITKKVIEIGDLGDNIVFNDGTLTYNKQDRTSKFVENNLIILDKYKAILNYQTTIRNNEYNIIESAINVGTYYVTLKFSLTDTTHYVLNEDEEDAVLEITPFEINNSYVTINADKEYDATTDLDVANIVINFTEEISETLKFTGNFQFSNVQDNINILNFKLEETTTANNYTVSPYFTPTADITKRKIALNLTQNGESDGEYIVCHFNSTVLKYDITKEKSSLYIKNTITKEVIMLTIKATQNDVSSTNYPLSFNALAGNYCMIDITSIKVYASNNKLISNGYANNYEFTELNGGLSFIENMVIIGFADNNLTYNGNTQQVNLIITEADDKETLYVVNGTNLFSLDCKFYDEDNNLTTLKDAGKYSLVVTDNRSEKFTFQNNEHSITLTNLEIKKAKITPEIDLTPIYYGENLNQSIQFDGIGTDGIITDTISYFENTSSYNIGSYPITNETAQLANSHPNYEIDLSKISSLIILPKLISISGLDYSNENLNLIYNGSDLTDDINSKISPVYKDADNNEISVNGQVSVKYYSNGKEINSGIINAGTYSVKYVSTNYIFLKDGHGETELVFDFLVNKKNIIVSYTIVPNLVYSAKEIKPATPSFEGICAIDEPFDQYQVTYSNNLPTIKNAGKYTANVIISSDNYIISSSSRSVEFEVAKYNVNIPVIAKGYFFKNYNENDTKITNTVNTLLGEVVEIEYSRENGEAVGFYDIIDPEITSANKINYSLNEFVGADCYEIKAIVGQEGVLIIQQIDNIEKIYDGIKISSINYNNLPKSAFSVSNYKGDELGVDEYNITELIFEFNIPQIVNCGDYSLKIKSATSSTHAGDIVFIDNQGKYKIIQKEITLNYDASKTITKQYDKTNSVDFGNALTINNADICAGDTISLKGEYITNNASDDLIEISNIYLESKGSKSENYKIINLGTYSGYITKRNITVIGSTANDFDKEYNKSTEVDVSKLTIENSLENISFSGNYAGFNVGEWDIIFTTTNTNYVIVGNYSGKINKKSLTLTSDSTLNKEFDGTTLLNSEDVKLDVDSIEDGDEVEIDFENSNYAGSVIGQHLITIVLKGTSSTNYIIESFLGNITDRLIKIVLHYGDEEDYKLVFVNDNQSIVKTNDSYKVIFGTAMNDEDNGTLVLAKPLRMGYNFNNWYTEPTYNNVFNEYTIINAENNFTLNALSENAFIIDLYAKYSIIEYDVTISVLTENLENIDYTISIQGGNYTIDGVNYTLESYETTWQYFSNHTIETSANTNFTLSDVLINEISSLNSYSSFTNINTNQNIQIKFSRNTCTLSLNLNEVGVVGLDASWSVDANNIATISKKFNSQIELPLISVTGKNLIGYSEINNGEIVYSTILGLDYTISGNASIFANWENKVLSIKISPTNSAVLVGEYTFDNIATNSILVEYGTPFGELPVYRKNGYIFSNYKLFSGNKSLTEQEITKDSILSFDYEDMVLFVNWLDGDNDFKITKTFDTSKYGINEYQEFENSISLTYKTSANGTTNNYLEDTIFTAKTNSIVTIVYSINKGYTVKGWKIDNQELVSGSNIIGNVTYVYNGKYLTISNFIWEENTPKIEIIYEPIAVVVNTNITNIEYTDLSWTIPELFEEDGVLKTYAGTIITLPLNIKDGYELDKEWTVENATSIFEDGVLTISDINDAITLNLTFDFKSYNIYVQQTDVDNGTTIKYSINNKAFVECTDNKISVRTGDVVIIETNTLFGHDLNNSWNYLGGGADVELTLISTVVDETTGATTTLKKLTGFTEEMSISLLTTLLKYNVSVSKLIYQPNEVEEYVADTSLNEVSVTSEENIVINEGYYSQVINFNVDYITKEVVNKHEQLVYNFLGWYNKELNTYCLKSEGKIFSTTINGEMNYIAVFQVRVVNVKFVLDDIKTGLLLAENETNAITSQDVVYNNAIYSNVVATPSRGYKFEKWVVSYIYDDSTIIKNELTVSKLTADEIKNVKCNIICTAYFKEYSININMSAEFNDGTEQPSEKIKIESNDYSGLELKITTLSSTNIQIIATVLKNGYMFNSWLIEAEEEEYIITFIETNSNNTQSTINLQFIGEEIEYSVKAIFEKAILEVNVGISPDKDEIIRYEGGMVCDEDNYYTGATMVYQTKIDETLLAYIKINKGYKLNEEVWCIYDDGIVVQKEDKTETLSIDEQKLYNQYFIVSISGFNTNTDVTIKVQRQKTILHLYERNFEAVNAEERYICLNIDAYVEFGMSEIHIGDANLLTPNRSSFEFLGWSTNVYGTGKIINANGVLAFALWNRLDTEINIYPMFELKKVKLNITVVPETAQKYESIYGELFNDLTLSSATSLPFRINDDYYFYTGASFNLTLPSTKYGYTFYGFRYLTINEINEIEWKEIKVDSEEYATEYSTNGMFKIEKYSDFEYTKASNFNLFNTYRDGVFYIEIVYGINYSLEAENYFNENRVSVIGGEVNVENTTTNTYALYNEEITVSAKLEDGYELKCWYINGELYDSTELSFNYTISIPTTFKAVFIGKKVIVSYSTETLHGKGNGIICGNGSKIDDNYYYCHVGDIISLKSIADVGYDFDNKWEHSNGTIYANTNNYLIEAKDAEGDGEITFKPLFAVRKIIVDFVMMNNHGKVTKNDVEFTPTEVTEGMLYSYTQEYFTDISAYVIATQKYTIDYLELFIDGEVKVMPENALNGTFVTLSSNEYFDDGRKFTIKVTFSPIYWSSTEDYLMAIKMLKENEEGVISLNKIFNGTGKSDDPYKIETIQELSLLAYIINNGLVQSSVNKSSYNSSNTYYEIYTNINASARYWTPIGTINHPFNANFIIYVSPSNMIVDIEDEIYPYLDSFNVETLSLYNNMFGCITDTASIVYKASNYTSAYLVIGLIFGLLILLVIIIFVINYIRNKRLEHFNQTNRRY